MAIEREFDYVTDDEELTDRERELTYKAEDQELSLLKCNNPDDLGYGNYAIINVTTGETIHPDLAGVSIYALDLEDVEEWLRSG